MNLAEVEELIARLKDQKLSRAYLQAIKPLGWRPKGYKLRTCFGLAEILNVQDRESEQTNPTSNEERVVVGYTSVVFTIELTKIERWVVKRKGQVLI